MARWRRGLLRMIWLENAADILMVLVVCMVERRMQGPNIKEE